MEGAKSFYREVFGWTTEEMPLPQMTYHLFKMGETSVAGMFAIREDMGPMPPHWATYFTVRTITAAVETITSLGGTVHMQPMTIAGVGQIAGAVSPQGVMFHAIPLSRVAHPRT